MTATEFRQHGNFLTRSWSPSSVGTFQSGVIVAMNGRTYLHTGAFRVTQYPVLQESHFSAWSPMQPNGLQTRTTTRTGLSEGWVSSAQCPRRSAMMLADDMEMMYDDYMEFEILPLDDESQVTSSLDADLFSYDTEQTVE